MTQSHDCHTYQWNYKTLRFRLNPSLPPLIQVAGITVTKQKSNIGPYIVLGGWDLAWSLGEHMYRKGGKIFTCLTLTIHNLIFCSYNVSMTIMTLCHNLLFSHTKSL